MIKLYIVFMLDSVFINVPLILPEVNMNMESGTFTIPFWQW